MKIEDWYAKNNFCLVMQYFCVCNKFAIGHMTPQGYVRLLIISEKSPMYYYSGMYIYFNLG